VHRRNPAGHRLGSQARANCASSKRSPSSLRLRSSRAGAATTELSRYRRPSRHGDDRAGDTAGSVRAGCASLTFAQHDAHRNTRFMSKIFILEGEPSSQPRIGSSNPTGSHQRLTLPRIASVRPLPAMCSSRRTLRLDRGGDERLRSAMNTMLPVCSIQQQRSTLMVNAHKLS
jgi:hypothetical protein